MRPTGLFFTLLISTHRLSFATAGNKGTHLRIVTVALFAVLLVSAPEARAQDAESQLFGRVTEVGSGTPVAGATVTLLPLTFGLPNLQEFKTDDTGYYRFVTVKEGTYSMRVSHDGFVDRDYKTDALPYPAFLRFDSSARFKEIDIQLQPESVIRGSVTDNGGEPIAGVTVSAVRQSDTIKNRVPTSSARTDSSGHFAIKKLPPGVYLVCASGTNGYGDPPYATHWYQEKWFENAATSDAATPITLGEHAVRSDVRITTRDEKRYRVIVWPSGRENASTPERYDVSILNRNTVEEGQKDGSWVIFDIPPGHYTVTSTAWSQVQYVGEGEQSFDVIDSDVTLRIHLGRLGEIAGVAHWLQPPKALPERLFMIKSEEGAAQGVMVKSQGRFDISRVLPGRYIFRPFEVHPPTIPKSVQCRGQDINKSSPLIIGDREQVLDCEVTLAEPE